MDNRAVSDLLDLIGKGTSPYHVVAAAANRLESAEFRRLDLRDKWKIRRGGAYYFNVFGSTFVAFRVGDVDGPIRLATAHTDFPCLRVKPAPEVRTHGYGKVNIEVYGGMIRESWLDRPLAIAGKVALRTADPFSPDVRLVDTNRPLLTIPRLAIHMNTAVNKGVELNPQKDMLPLMTMMGKQADEAYFLPCLAEAADCQADDILSYDLTVYPWETGCLCGAKNEFISSPRLDNLTSVAACLAGILDVDTNDASKEALSGLRMIALFDNEEVGSRTKQGAASLVLPQILRRIYRALGCDDETFDRQIAGGFCLSLDVAHALHPNAPEKNDVTNFPVLNGGVVLKTACSQSYAGDAEAVAVIRSLCDVNGIPCQQFVNRSDMRGGSTLGSILSANLPMRTMDAGAPILAMHSARETMGCSDQNAMDALVKAFLR